MSFRPAKLLSQKEKEEARCRERTDESQEERKEEERKDKKKEGAPKLQLLLG